MKTRTIHTPEDLPLAFTDDAPLLGADADGVLHVARPVDASTDSQVWRAVCDEVSSARELERPGRVADRALNGDDVRLCLGCAARGGRPLGTALEAAAR